MPAGGRLSSYPAKEHTLTVESTLTPAGARKARELAEQTLAQAFDAKSSAAERLANLNAKLAQAPSSVHPGSLSVAIADVDKAKAGYADAQAAVDQTAKVEREATARKAGRR